MAFLNFSIFIWNLDLLESRYTTGAPVHVLQVPLQDFSRHQTLQEIAVLQFVVFLGAACGSPYIVFISTSGM